MSELIKKLRLRKNITQKEVADNAGVKQSTISRIEQDCSNTSWKLIVKILLFLKVDNKEIKRYILNFCSSKNYDFLYFLLQDDKVRKTIAKDPIYCAETIRKNLYYKNLR